MVEAIKFLSAGEEAGSVVLGETFEVVVGLVSVELVICDVVVDGEANSEVLKMASRVTSGTEVAGSSADEEVLEEVVETMPVDDT